ncbi:MAG: hypothetical protein HY673_10840 [Chloroflexi bacterium]|nr:hypothetical protein [Chloroflexota bacterium]
MNSRHDNPNRLKEKKSTGNTLASYSYDDVSSGNYGYGRRTGMDSSATAAGTAAYKYDARGRLGQEVRTVDFADYITRYSYDSADRVSSVQIAFKQSGNETILDAVTQGYNGRGLPSSLTSSANGTIVSSVLYNNLALPSEINLGNNTRTTYGYWGIEQSGGYYGKLYSIKTVKNPRPQADRQWEKIGERNDPAQPKDGESIRELWRKKKTGDLLERHVLERGTTPAKGHPHYKEPNPSSWSFRGGTND